MYDMNDDSKEFTISELEFMQREGQRLTQYQKQRLQEHNKKKRLQNKNKRK